MVATGSFRTSEITRMPRSTRLTETNRGWRIAEPGTRDIINMLTSPTGAPFVEVAAADLLQKILAGFDGADPHPSPACAILRHHHGSGRDEVAVRALLDGSIADSAELKDEVLLAPLTVPADYTPPKPISAWIDTHLPKQVAKDLGCNSSDLATTLTRLRFDDSEAWNLLVHGQLGSALRLNRPFAGLSLGETDETI
jgi:hypothetical protein